MPGEAATLGQHLLFGRVVAGLWSSMRLATVSRRGRGGVHRTAAQPGPGPHHQPDEDQPEHHRQDLHRDHPTGAEPANRSYRAG